MPKLLFILLFTCISACTFGGKNYSSLKSSANYTTNKNVDIVYTKAKEKKENAVAGSGADASYESTLLPKFQEDDYANSIVRLENNGDQKRLVGTNAIIAANEKAAKEPVSDNYINSIMYFNYMPGALYQIYCAPLSITDVQLRAGERIISVAGGDTLRWQVSKTFSGVSERRCEHLLIKPTESGLTNTLVITTDQRTYHLVLYSKDKIYIPVVAWNYSDSENSINNFIEMRKNSVEPYMEIAGEFDVNKLDFSYKIKSIRGLKPKWMPQMVFNDGNKTYIKFPREIQELPVLFIGDNKSNAYIVNYRVVGDYYVVDIIFNEAKLSLGNRIVQISMLK